MAERLFTIEQLWEIQDKWDENKGMVGKTVFCEALGEQYECSYNTIRRIVNGKYEAKKETE